MKKTYRSIIMVLAIVTIVPVSAYPAMAEDQATVQKQEKLMAQVQQDTGMSAAEMEGLRLQLNNAIKAAGDGGAVRTMARIAHQEGCRGECLGAALDALTRAMNRNYSTDDAQSLIRMEIRTCVRERAQTGISETEMAQRLRTRLEQRIQTKVTADPESTGGTSGRSSGSSRSGQGGRK